MCSNFRIYCSDESSDSLGQRRAIHVPKELPEVLRKFCKAAIQSQPADLLQWSFKYFLDLADESTPNASPSELEYSDINVGILRVLHSQFKNGSVVVQELETAWDSLFLDRKLLVQVLSVEGFSQKPSFEINWLRFLAQICRAITETLDESLEYICKVLTECTPESEPKIPLDLLESFYLYLGSFEPGLTEDHIDDVMNYLNAHVIENVSPADFLNPSCPRMSGTVN